MLNLPNLNTLIGTDMQRRSDIRAQPAYQEANLLPRSLYLSVGLYFAEMSRRNPPGTAVGVGRRVIDAYANLFKITDLPKDTIYHYDGQCINRSPKNID